MCRLMKKEEVITRLNLLNDNMQTKLADRPTIGYMKKLLEAFESKLSAV